MLHDNAAENIEVCRKYDGKGDAKMKYKKLYRQIIAYLLIFAMLMTQANVAAAEVDSGNETVEIITESADESIADESTAEESTTDESTTEESTTDKPAADEKPSDVEEAEPAKSEDESEKTQEESVDISLYYQDGRICIYNYSQLLLIGTGKSVREEDINGSAGQGEEVQADGGTLLYGLNQSYVLMNDLQVDTANIWSFPEGFTGSLTSKNERTENLVYDENTDTIYVYNRYQLTLMMSENAENELVMSEDNVAEMVGSGQVITRSDGSLLTYGKSHKYQIASNFTTETPELLSQQVMTAAEDGAEGRDFAGQVIKTIGDKTYILIGNAQQLRKIGSNDTVYGAVYQAIYQVGGGWKIDTKNSTDGKPIMLYGGDADLLQSQNGKKDYKLGKSGIDSAKGGLVDTVGRCGVNQSTGEIDPSLDIDKAANQTYSTTADYIIFRDIYLTDNGTADGTTEAWDPIENFTGTMKGQLGMVAGKNATIHNVTINQNKAINQDSYSASASYAEYGVGFFRNLSTPYDSTLQFTEKKIEISNLTLNQVSVTTSTTSISQSFSLISVLLKPLLNALGLSSGLEKDPKSLSTGALAGVVKGNVAITNCNVTELSGVQNANNWTGGLVGYASGMTKYDALTGTAAGLVTTLSSLLNLVPVLGLGDLVTVLLKGGVLDVSQLIPAGYTNAVITGCTVQYSDSAQVSGKAYTGGFVGETTGTVISGCKIVSKGVNNITGTDYVGGFDGKVSNAVVAGALNSLGIELMGNFPVNTVLLNSDITGSGQINVTASSTEDNRGYAGGFVGSMSNSYAVDCDISNLGTVTGNDYAGGFTGKASLGNLADIDENKGLLELVKSLLTTIVAGKANAEILNLVGLRPSVITGCHVFGGDIVIKANGDYAGGLVGYAGALQISNTSELADASKATTTTLNRVMNKTNLSYNFGDNGNQLSASGNISVNAVTYAGGALGKATMTSVSDVLSGTVSAADYIRFELKDVTINSSLGISVEATGNDGYAGGVIGQAVGGEVRTVSLSSLSDVKAALGAGGFSGYFGSGTLADVGGVNLLGLSLLKIDGLLSVADMIETFSSSCSVSGIESGFTVSTTDDAGKSGGFIGYCISGRTSDSTVENVKKVGASVGNGKAGGFIGYAKAGDAVATVGDSIGQGGTLEAAKIENLLGVISALTPEFHNTTITFVDNGSDPQIYADMSGGFVGDAMAIDVNYSVNHPAEGEGSNAKTTIKGLKAVSGITYAGGFAGCLLPGDVAQTGSINLLGLLSVSQLLSVMDVAYPKISNSEITGNELVVIAEGEKGDVALGDAGGFVGNGKAVTIENSNIAEVKEVTAPYHAGGYMGIMRSGSVAEAGDATGALLNSVLGKILSVKELAGVLQAAGCEITNSKVSGISEGMTIKAACRADNPEAEAAAMAGGFVGEMQSGTVDNQANAEEGAKGTAVENLLRVEGLRHAGGFGGLVKAGSVAEVAKDSAILTKVVETSDLLSVINAFVPVIHHASVRSVKDGFTVQVTGSDENDNTSDSTAGSAGGFAGYACGVQVSSSDVNCLSNTEVTEPTDLQAVDGSSYFGEESAYAVKAYRYAGGYFGKLDIGSTAAIGGSSILSKLIKLGDAVSALNVVVSIVEHSDVHGALGGFNILAANAAGVVGKAGGFAGNMLGSQIQDSNVYNFAHIIGRESAGGYAGTIEPGSVSTALGNLAVLNGLISADNLLGVLRTFIPTIKNSETTCIPCGGAVRADAKSSDGIIRGLAGGYVGYNFGGQIWGNNTEKWKGSAYTGTTRVCAVQRIRSVYGVEYAGGYTGLMQCANVADTGNLNVLRGIISIDNPLILLQAVYPTEENTAVYGPLRNLDMDTWNSWVTHVGAYGSYGNLLQGLGTVTDQDTLNKYIQQYAYGYAVTAGRNSVAEKLTQGGVAGGYVGRMEGGTITNAAAKDLKSTEAFRSVGGFAGEMITGSVAKTGDISLAGIDIAGKLPLLQPFVPVIKTSSVEGYQSGAKIKAVGISGNNKVGMAGGYVGRMVGGQIWGSEEANGCSITKLRRVDGTSYVGGYAGLVEPGSAATVDTASNQGLLNQIISHLIASPNDLAKVLSATVATIRYAEASSWDKWGIIVNGAYTDASSNTAYATAAGGFAGSLSGAVVGEEHTDNSGIKATQIRSVIGGEYAGGGFGIADVASVAQVSGDGTTTILGLIQAGSIDVLDAFRTYVYHSAVSGSEDAGLSVSAKTQTKEGQDASVVYSGNAGGFGGSLLDGSVKNSTVTNLAKVTGLNYSGGFVGYSGKSGVVDVDKVNILGDTYDQLLGGSLGVLDVFGSNIHDCSVSGKSGGYNVASSGGEESIAGGFVGYGNLARIVNGTAGGEKQENGLNQVYSDGIAGGFTGKTNFAYLGDVQLKSTLVNALLTVVLNPLVKALYLDSDKIASSELLDINLGLIKVKALYDGNLISLNLLGLKITVALSKKSAENNQETDFAIITIGDSTVKLPCTSAGLTDDETNKQNIRVTLIKANRTKVESSVVNGTKFGYDVYGGSAGNSVDAANETGYSGGFIGYNNEGLLLENNMYLCDVVKGKAEQIGPFTGLSKLDSQYDFNTLAGVEGNNNLYRIYRTVDAVLNEIKKGTDSLNIGFVAGSNSGGINTYTLSHITSVKNYQALENANMVSNSSAETVPLEAYVSSSKAVLMGNTDSVTTDSSGTVSPEPSETQDPCDDSANITINKVWKDHNNMDNLRPEKITITVWRTWTENSVEKKEAVPGYENYEITGAAADDTWQKIINGLPAYAADADGNILYYYTYSVTEAEIAGYTTKIEISEDGYTFTITNQHYSILPDTGGKGILIFILLGGLILSYMAYTGYRKRKKRGVQ